MSAAVETARAADSPRCACGRPAVARAHERDLCRACARELLAKAGARARARAWRRARRGT